MKKIFFIILIFLIIPLVSSAEINMENEFSQGETLMARVSGNFLEPVLEENIFFYRGHVKIPLEYDIAEIDDDFYIYALLENKAPNNYSISLENVKYMVGAEISDEDIVKDFVITNETADFSIHPGFIITRKDFSIEVQNLQDYEITIDIDKNQTEGFFAFLFEESGEGESVTLKSGEIKDINFVPGNKTDFRILKLSTENLTYEIPVYVFVSQIQEEPEEKNETSMNMTGEQEEIKNKSETEEPIKTATTKNCADANGTICGDDEKCSETPIQAGDATCCLGNCEKIKEKITGKIIGWAILIIVLVIIIWFFRKKSGTKKKVNLLDIAKGKR